MNKKLLSVLLALVGAQLSPIASADGTVVDKIYHPYVLPNEREFEWRLSSRQNQSANQLNQRFAFGISVAETVMVEAYLIGERNQYGDFGLQAYEIETRWMLTQQGQFWADWGLLFELEKQHRRNNYEVASGVLFEKEVGQLSLTLNAFLIYEWGQDIDSEFETQFSAQLRYRWIPQLQPAIELYQGEDFIGIGPAFMGIERFSGQRQIKWEASFIAALDSNRKDHTLRIAIEYEF